jgi:hypothetical protein
MLRNPRALGNLRALDRALTDLIDRRKNNTLLSADRKLLDRMITDLRTEAQLRGIVLKTPTIHETSSTKTVSSRRKMT